MSIEGILSKLHGTDNNNFLSSASSTNIYEGVKSSNKYRKISSLNESNQNGGKKEVLSSKNRRLMEARRMNRAKRLAENRRLFKKGRRLFEEEDEMDTVGDDEFIAPETDGAEGEDVQPSTFVCGACDYEGDFAELVVNESNNIVCPSCGALLLAIPQEEDDTEDGEETDSLEAPDADEPTEVTEARRQKLLKRLREARAKYKAKKLRESARRSARIARGKRILEEARLANRKNATSRRGRRLFEEDEYVPSADITDVTPIDYEVAGSKEPVVEAQITCGVCGYTASSADFVANEEGNLICPSCGAIQVTAPDVNDNLVNDNLEDLDVVEPVAPIVTESVKLSPYKRILKRSLVESKAPRAMFKALYEGRIKTVENYIMKNKKSNRR